MPAQTPPAIPAPVPVPKTSPAPEPDSNGDVGSDVDIPLQSVLNGLPNDLKDCVCDLDIRGATMTISLERILAQLPSGAVKISFGSLRHAAPELFLAGTDFDSRDVALPLDEILAKINPAMVCRPQEPPRGLIEEKRVFSSDTETIVPAQPTAPPRGSTLSVPAASAPGAIGGETTAVPSTVQARSAPPPTAPWTSPIRVPTPHAANESEKAASIVRKGEGAVAAEPPQEIATANATPVVAETRSPTPVAEVNATPLESPNAPAGQTTYPRLRSDLIVSQQETPAGPVFVIKDPLIGRFVRFKAPEHFIAQQFDGATPVEEVRRRVEIHFDAPLSLATLEKFTARLQTLGLLEDGQVREHRQHHQHQPRVRGNIFALRLKVFDPDKFLTALAPQLSFFFTRTFAVLSVLTLLTALGVTVTNWEEIHRSLRQLYRVETIPLAWFTLLCIVIGHEFSHGLACKRYGGKVHEIGFLLIYLQPAMYCNVSDAWLFPEKSKRLLVTLAGAWFELTVWALATLFWRVTEPGSLPNYLALIVATTLGIKSLFNLNPLIKLDGYYLLSDYLEIPNLRQRAFSYIGNRLRYFWRPVDRTTSTPRERRIYWLYGIQAWIYSVWIIGYILLSLGRFLIARYQGWGAAFMAALVISIFRHPLKRYGRFLASQFTPKRGMLLVMKRIAIMAVVFAAAGSCLYFIRTDLKISGEFRILPLHNADVRAEVEGIIEEILHDEGDQVAAGELIARLSDRDLRAELEKVTDEIAEKQAKLKLLKAGARAEEIELANVTVAKDEERLKFAQSLLQMEQTLYEQKLSSKKDLQLAADQAALRTGELQESKGNLKLLLAGSREEVIEATEAEISRLQTQRKYLQDQIQRLQVTSPIAGVVTTHRLKEIRGASVKKGDLIAEVHEFRTVTAEISVPEKDIADVKIGLPVTLKARAHINTNFYGKVVSIAPVASKAAEGIQQRNFLVVTELENSSLLLKPEMTGNAKISCGTHRLYENVFRRFIHFIRVEFWSWF
jgi:putative peptide zinc metalloprotease protein